jgi:membrane fusion protein (multidrug efflux system)
MTYLRPQMTLQNAPVVVPALLLALSLAAMTSCTKTEASAPQTPPPPDVQVVEVVQRDVPIYGDWVATLDGYVNAQIQPQVSGYLIRQNYKEGSFVHKDDVLFEIDPRPFQAVLDQAKGQVAQARGQLAQAMAQLGLAEINVKRDTPLAAARAIAQSQLDNDIQAKAAAEAAVQADKASIEAAQAAVETAQLNLGFTKVRSLVDGIAGVANTQMGNLVNASTVLTTVSQVNPIKVFFPISEQEYLEFAQRKTGSMEDLLRNTRSLSLQLTLSNGSQYPRAGHIIFADREVNPQTGTIRIAASFPNPGNILRPGQFGRVRAMTTMRKGALLVPQRCVTELQGSYQVALVDQNHKVTIKTVTPGNRVGSLWIINQGLNPGDTVVSEGVSKVRDGMTVNPKQENPESEKQEDLSAGQ